VHAAPDHCYFAVRGIEVMTIRHLGLVSLAALGLCAIGCEDKKPAEPESKPAAATAAVTAAPTATAAASASAKPASSADADDDDDDDDDDDE
jgi:hypothetical protein